VYTCTYLFVSYGCRKCFLPKNPIFINCDNETKNVVDSGRRTEWRPLVNHNEKTSRLVSADDVMVKQSDRGVYFSPTNRFKVKPAASRFVTTRFVVVGVLFISNSKVTTGSDRRFQTSVENSAATWRTQRSTDLIQLLRIVYIVSNPWIRIQT